MWAPTKLSSPTPNGPDRLLQSRGLATRIGRVGHQSRLWSRRKGLGAMGTDDSIAVASLLPVVRRRWRMILGCLVLGAVAAISFSVHEQKQYTASSVLLFRDPGFDQQLFGNQVFLPSTDPTTQGPTNLELVSLPVVASRAAAALHLSTSAVNSAVSVSGVGQANVAKISATDPFPARAAQIATTYAEQYVLFRQQMDRAKISGAQRLVERQLQSMTPAQRDRPNGQALQNRANELSELAALQTGNAEVEQPATIPKSPSSPRTMRNGILGALLGLLVGIGLAFVAERADRRIGDSSELEDIYCLPVLGAVPTSLDVARAEIVPPAGVGAEAFGLLRARLRYFNVDRDLRSLLITSSVPEEGKTTIAMNLAIAQAAPGHAEVALVEADLRRPSLAARLGIERGPGLAQILSKNAPLDAATRHVAVPRTADEHGATASLTVITAGGVPPNPAELLESRAMVDLLSALHERFDLVIVDTPPISIVPDAIPLIRLVTGVLIVSRIGVTTRDAARQLRAQLSSLNAPTLGVISNGEPANSFPYAHYRHYYPPNSARAVALNGTPAGAGDVRPR